MFKLLNIIIIIISVLMICIILLQESREGIIPSGGGGGPVRRIGFKQKSSFLEQLTWGFITIIFTLSLITSLVVQEMTHHKISPNIKKVQDRGLLLEHAKDITPTKEEDTASTNKKTADD